MELNYHYLSMDLAMDSTTQATELHSMLGLFLCIYTPLCSGEVGEREGGRERGRRE